MGGRIASVKIDRVQVPAIRDLRSRLLKRCVAGSLFLMVGLLPLGARAQITSPLLPLLPSPPLPTVPTQPAAAPAPPAYAGETVTSRIRPEFNPIGVRVGDFFWFPRGELDEAYNSNIFATPSSPTHDFITGVLPSFDLLSIFPRNALNFHGSSALQFYTHNGTQNTQDAFLSTDGRLDVTAGSSFYGNAQATHQHISYGSPNSPGNIAQPVTYWTYTARGGYAQGGRRFSWGVEAGSTSAQYNGVPLVGGGVLPQSTADATFSDVAVNASYEIIPDYLGYARFDAGLFDYWHTSPGGLRPNSKVYRADVGLQILPRHIIYGQVYVGYLVQNFDQSSLGSFHYPDFGGRLVWNVTPLNTLTFNGLRTFVQGGSSNPSVGITGPAGNGYLATTVQAVADHELLRNLLLNVNGSYENDTFQGISRTDNVFTAGAGVTYLVNRHLFLGGSFSYQRRNSTFSGSSYTQDVLLLRVGTQL